MAWDNSIMNSSQSEDWTTPDDLFEKLNSEFHFTLDAAASESNAKCNKYYSLENDGLKANWGG